MSASSSSSSPWTDLELDLADLLLRRLPSHIDRVRFAAVCRHWRYAAREQSPPALPWISFRTGAMESLSLSRDEKGVPHLFRFTKQQAASVCSGSFGDWQLFKVAGVGPSRRAPLHEEPALRRHCPAPRPVRTTSACQSRRLITCPVFVYPETFYRIRDQQDHRVLERPHRRINRVRVPWSPGLEAKIGCCVLQSWHVVMVTGPLQWRSWSLLLHGHGIQRGEDLCRHQQRPPRCS
jgi:hypothetical protein